MNKELQKEISEKIQKGTIKAHSRMYFILRIALGVLITLFSFGLLVFFASFILFGLRMSGIWFLPRFGFGVFGIFLKSLPWFLISIAILSSIVLGILVRRFSFAYHEPILYSMLISIIIVFLGGLLIMQTQIHPMILMKAEEGKLPLLGKLYDQPKDLPIYYGTVAEVRDGLIYLDTIDGDRVSFAASTTQFVGNPEKGDSLVVLRNKKNGAIELPAARKVDVPRFFRRRK